MVANPIRLNPQGLDHRFALGCHIRLDMNQEKQSRPDKKRSDVLVRSVYFDEVQDHSDPYRQIFRHNPTNNEECQVLLRSRGHKPCIHQSIALPDVENLVSQVLAPLFPKPKEGSDTLSIYQTEAHLLD